MKTRRPRTETCGTKTEPQIKYHEQIFSVSIVPDRIEAIQVLYLTNQTCLLTQRNMSYGQLYQRQQTGPE